MEGQSDFDYLLTMLVIYKYYTCSTLELVKYYISLCHELKCHIPVAFKAFKRRLLIKIRPQVIASNERITLTRIVLNQTLRE